MHFAFPPRKSSNPPPYAPRSAAHLAVIRLLRNKKVLAVIALGVTFLYSLLNGIFQNSSDYIPPGTPPVVIVTVLNPRDDAGFSEKIRANRKDYADRHGYTTFFPLTTDYDIGRQPESWSKVPAMRHAMTKFPHSTYFWYLDESSLIMDPTRSIETQVMEKSRLENLMIVNVPVVPPDSVIKTFSHLNGDRIDLVLTQDKEGLSPASFIVRRGDWAKYFLDAWYDPIYRSYNFQKADTHALEHIVQWHGTILAKLALVPQRILNSYTRENGARSEDLFSEGDFVASFYSCTKDAKRNCKEEMMPFITVAEKKYIR